jgi:NhaP-type Na+/H+ or K+/H+ antiporter
MYETLALLAAFVLVYSAAAGGVEHTRISGPMVFMGFGLVVGPLGLGLLSIEPAGETLRTLAELTLALVLFTDAAGADLTVLRRVSRLPARLLLVGLPLTILLGYGVGVLMFDDLSVFGVALLATMLAPTDAALGKAVVTNEEVPGPAREGLNVESGLNDGICVPILFVFLALAQGEAGAGGPWHLAVGLVIREIGIGAITGLGLTAVAIAFLRLCARRGWVSDVWIQVPVIALAFACFAAAQTLGGSGFIASFVGGLFFGSRLSLHREKLLLAAEGTGNAFALLTWTVFGAAVVGQALPHMTWAAVLYSVLSLTLIRMLPVFLCVAGLGVSTEGKLFLGWFGPRGLASIVFAVIVVNAGLPDSGPLSLIVSCTVILSIVAHGVTANPWARGFGARRRAAETS